MPKGETEHFERSTAGDYSSQKFDPQGHLVRTEDTKATGESKVQEQLTPNIVKIYERVKGKFGSIVTKVPTDEVGTLKGPEC